MLTSGGADAFIAVYEGLDEDAPIRVAYTTVRTAGQRAEWVLANDVAEDGTIYVAGTTTGSLPGTDDAVGEGDAWIMALSPELEVLATAQFGTPRNDVIRSLRLDEDGSIVAGHTAGALFRDAPVGRSDVFVARYSASLERLAGVQLGTPHEDRAKLVRDTSGWLLGGTTEGVVHGASAGSFDGWWASLDDELDLADAPEGR